MELTKITIKDVTNGIYTARQCADEDDCNLAIQMLKGRQRIYPHYHSALEVRIRNIYEKMAKIKSQK